MKMPFGDGNRQQTDVLIMMMSQYSVVNYWRALKFTARQVKNNNKVYVSSLLPVTTCAKL